MTETTQLLIFHSMMRTIEFLHDQRRCTETRKRVRIAVAIAVVLKTVSVPVYPSPSPHRPQAERASVEEQLKVSRCGDAACS